MTQGRPGRAKRRTIFRSVNAFSCTARIMCMLLRPFLHSISRPHILQRTMAIKTSSPPASKVATRSDSNASTAQRKIKDDEQAASDRSSPLSSPPALPSSPPATKARAKKANATTPKRKLKADVEGADSNGPTPSPGRAKKLALLKTFSASPFPGFERPSAEECRDVHDRLSTVHGTPKRPEALVDDPK